MRAALTHGLERGLVAGVASATTLLLLKPAFWAGAWISELIHA